MAVTFERFINAFLIQQLHHRGCHLLNNEHYQIVKNEDLIKEFFNVIFDLDFEAFTDNFISQQLEYAGNRLISNDTWKDCTDHNLVKFFLLVPWEAVNTK